MNKKKNTLRLTGTPDEFQKMCEPIQKGDPAQRLRACESIRNEPTPPLEKYEYFPCLTDYVQHALQSVYDGKIRHSFAEKFAARLLYQYIHSQEPYTLRSRPMRGNKKKRLSLRQ